MYIIRRVAAMAPVVYTRVYPPAYDADHVKATSSYGLGFEPYLSLDPALSLEGTRYETSWLTPNETVSNQRYNIALSSAETLKRIVYLNMHHDWYDTISGVNAFTVQGSNSATAFANTAYTDNTDWTDIATDVSFMSKHIEGHEAVIMREMLLTNSTAYQYYSIKCATNHGGNNMGFRRLELYK